MVTDFNQYDAYGIVSNIEMMELGLAQYGTNPRRVANIRALLDVVEYRAATSPGPDCSRDYYRDVICPMARRLMNAAV